MKDYVAWLDGVSVAYGTLKHCEEKAKAIFNTDRWKEFGNKESTLKITRGAKQLFVKSIILK